MNYVGTVLCLYIFLTDAQHILLLTGSMYSNRVAKAKSNKISPSFSPSAMLFSC